MFKETHTKQTVHCNRCSLFNANTFNSSWKLFCSPSLPRFPFSSLATLQPASLKYLKYSVWRKTTVTAAQQHDTTECKVFQKVLEKTICLRNHSLPPCRACILDVHTTINFPQASWSFIMSRAESVSKLGQEFYGNMALDTSWPIGQRAAQLS